MRSDCGISNGTGEDDDDEEDEEEAARAPDAEVGMLRDDAAAPARGIEPAYTDEDAGTIHRRAGAAEKEKTLPTMAEMADARANIF